MMMMMITMDSERYLIQIFMYDSYASLLVSAVGGLRLDLRNFPERRPGGCKQTNNQSFVLFLFFYVFRYLLNLHLFIRRRREMVLRDRSRLAYYGDLACCCGPSDYASVGDCAPAHPHPVCSRICAYFVFVCLC